MRIKRAVILVSGGFTEHEILKVTSGYSVTLTHNLYLVDPIPGEQAPSVIPDLGDVLNLQSMLRTLLKSPESLPDGGMLGFRLAHLYPVTFKTQLSDMQVPQSRGRASVSSLLSTKTPSFSSHGLR